MYGIRRARGAYFVRSKAGAGPDRTGTIVVDGAAEWTGKDVPVSAYHWEGGGKLFGLTIVAATEAGVARVPSVPAGKGRIVRPDATNFDFAKWPTLLEVEVPAGGEVRVRLT